MNGKNSSFSPKIMLSLYTNPLGNSRIYEYEKGSEAKMALCRFAGEYLNDNFSLLDNLFIAEFLPVAPESAVKVYIYGLYQCAGLGGGDLNTFAESLFMDPLEVKESFRYWQELGLVSITSQNPLEVRYLPVKNALSAPKKYNPEKFSAFNAALQELYPSRMITPNEYNKYYDFIETTKMEAEAVLMVVKYCLNLKGSDTRYPYILAVAGEWAKEGKRTVEDVNNRICENEAASEIMTEVMNALGKRMAATFDDRQFYVKWTKTWGFSHEAILLAAKQFKNKGSIRKLDNVLDEYFRMGIFTCEEIGTYAQKRERMYELAKKINKNIGVYYESLDHVVEYYISEWLKKGFDDDSLLTLSRYCFMHSIRTLEGMNEVISKFFKLGLINTESINEYIDKMLKRDEFIKKIILACGSSRAVTAADREFYTIWKDNWGFSDEIIEYAAGSQNERMVTFRQINQTLAKFREQNIDTLEKAKKAIKTPVSSKKTKTEYIEREYTKQELDSFFTNIDEIDEV